MRRRSPPRVTSGSGSVSRWAPTADSTRRPVQLRISPAFQGDPPLGAGHRFEGVRQGGRVPGILELPEHPLSYLSQPSRSLADSFGQVVRPSAAHLALEPDIPPFSPGPAPGTGPGLVRRGPRKRIIGPVPRPRARRSRSKGGGRYASLPTEVARVPRSLRMREFFTIANDRSPDGQVGMDVRRGEPHDGRHHGRVAMTR